MKYVILLLALTATSLNAGKAYWSNCKDFTNKLMKVDEFITTGTVARNGNVSLTVKGTYLMDAEITQAFAHEELNGLVVKNSVYQIPHFTAKKGAGTYVHNTKLPNIPLKGKLTGKYFLEDAAGNQLQCAELLVKF